MVYVILPLAILISVISSLCALKVIIVGGGAAGYFSAINFCLSLEQNENHEVSIFEATKSQLSKVLISGGARCNLMHDPSKGADQISLSYPRGYKQLLSPLKSAFSPDDTYNWFQEKLHKQYNGNIHLKIESDGRVFPSSDKSSSIADLLKEMAKELNVKEKLQCGVSQIHVLNNTKNEGSFLLTYTAGVDKEEQKIICDRVIVATGSSRIGHRILSNLGHKIQPPLPSLFSFKVDDKGLTSLSGISMKSAKVRLILPKDFKTEKESKKLARDQLIIKNIEQSGPLLITKQGFSGPSILRISSYAARILAFLDYKFSIEINFLGEISTAVLLELLKDEKKDSPKRAVGKYFPSFPQLSDNTGNTEPIITKRLWQYILLKTGVDPSIPLGALSDKKLNDISKSVTGSIYNVTGRGMFRDEFVTCGGVDLKEVTLSTMESKICPGLYMCGEVLDIDGVT